MTDRVTDPPAIRLDRITKSYDDGHVVAVSNVTAEIARGSFVAIVGGSGSGKTTTLKTINRLVEPDSGTVYVDGVSVTESPPHQLRRRIGYVFQGIGLFPHLTVEENIGITAQLSGWPADHIKVRTDELLGLVDLPVDYAPRFPAELSGGQRQRVGIARALAARPLIMLMDEPFGALDPVTRDTLGTEYRRLHAKIGLTTVMVTHDILEAVLLADRILVMRAGVIVADGEPHELLRHHEDEGVRALMDMPQRQAQRVRELVEERNHRG